MLSVCEQIPSRRLRSFVRGMLLNCHAHYEWKKMLKMVTNSFGVEIASTLPACATATAASSNTGTPTSSATTTAAAAGQTESSSAAEESESSSAAATETSCKSILWSLSQFSLICFCSLRIMRTTFAAERSRATEGPWLRCAASTEAREYNSADSRLGNRWKPTPKPRQEST